MEQRLELIREYESGLFTMMELPEHYVSAGRRCTSGLCGTSVRDSRVYLFSNGGNQELYLGSADLMHRNLNRPVEVMFPIQDPQLRLRLESELLENAIADNTKIRWLQSDGSYQRVSPDGAEHRNFRELMAKIPGVEWFVKPNVPSV